MVADAIHGLDHGRSRHLGDGSVPCGETCGYSGTELAYNVEAKLCAFKMICIDNGAFVQFAPSALLPLTHR